MDPEEYDLYYDAAEEFQETELDYVERDEWEGLLDLYKRELDHIGEADEEEANDLRSRIEAVKDRIYENAESSQY